MVPAEETVMPEFSRRIFRMAYSALMLRKILPVQTKRIFVMGGKTWEFYFYRCCCKIPAYSKKSIAAQPKQTGAGMTSTNQRVGTTQQQRDLDRVYNIVN